MSRIAAFTIALALAASGCTGGPTARRTPIGEPPTTLEGGSPPVEPSPSPSVPFAPAVDCEDATVGGATVTLRLQDNVFDPPCLVMLGGQRLRLVNAGANLHNFTLEDTEVDMDVPPGETGTTDPLGQLVASETYNMFCKYHRDLGMEGDLTITPVG
jgi:plastocyanin